MRLALVNGQRCEAGPGLRGVCQACQSPMVPKCGTLRVWHWAHQSKRRCDPWWEETEWHVVWKNRFPLDWQEIVQTGPGGELHIADVKLPNSCVLEFQHSPISETERQSREVFYKSMIWVIDGLRRKRTGRLLSKRSASSAASRWSIRVLRASALCCAIGSDAPWI